MFCLNLLQKVWTFLSFIINVSTSEGILRHRVHEEYGLCTSQGEHGLCLARGGHSNDHQPDESRRVQLRHTKARHGCDRKLERIVARSRTRQFGIGCMNPLEALPGRI